MLRWIKVLKEASILNDFKELYKIKKNKNNKSVKSVTHCSVYQFEEHLKKEQYSLSELKRVLEQFEE